jgi:hypothetical protein
VNFDISFDASNGPQAAENVKVLMSRLPAMRPLILVLKVFLQQRELNEACLNPLDPGRTHCNWHCLSFHGHPSLFVYLMGNPSLFLPYGLFLAHVPGYESATRDSTVGLQLLYRHVKVAAMLILRCTRGVSDPMRC